MASIVHVVCKTCGEAHWVGQIPAWSEDNMIIYSSPQEVGLSAAFYMKHLGHELTAADDHGFNGLIESGVVKNESDQ